MNKKSLENKINNKWDDEEVLEALGLFLDRVQVSSTFIQTPEGLLTHEALVFQAGDKVIISDPRELDWPLQAAINVTVPAN